MSEQEMPAHQADDGQIPFDSAESEQEVEISEAGSATAETSPAPVEAETSPDEHADYGDKVQRRINQLTKRMKDAERERDEATRYAQVVQQEATHLKTRMQSLDQNYLTEYGGRVSAEQQQAQAQLKRAKYARRLLCRRKRPEFRPDVARRLVNRPFTPAHGLATFNSSFSAPSENGWWNFNSRQSY